MLKKRKLPPQPLNLQLALHKLVNPNFKRSAAAEHLEMENAPWLIPSH